MKSTNSDKLMMNGSGDISPDATKIKTQAGAKNNHIPASWVS